MNKRIIMRIVSEDSEDYGINVNFIYNYLEMLQARSTEFNYCSGRWYPVRRLTQEQVREKRRNNPFITGYNELSYVDTPADMRLS